MRNRVLFLLITLIFRSALGLVLVGKYTPGEIIRVTGYPNNLYQDITNCIIKIDRFIFSSKNICAKYHDTEIRVTGTITWVLIDRIKGNIHLRDATLEEISTTPVLTEDSAGISDLIDNLRDFLVSIYQRFIPEPEAGLLSGIVLGYKKDIGLEFYKQIVNSGTIHIAVASGYNILLVGGAVMSFSFWFCKRGKAIWVSIFAMIFYAVLAGGDPPVVRAVWMAGLLYIGQVLGRGALSALILTLTAWLMLMIDPGLIISASFQLSVAASYGLMVLEPRISGFVGRYIGEKALGVVSSVGILTTFSTMIMTLPILWWHFGRMSLIGILSNSLILPFVPVVMILGTGMILLPWVFSVPAYVFAHWIVVMIRFFGN